METSHTYSYRHSRVGLFGFTWVQSFGFTSRYTASFRVLPVKHIANPCKHFAETWMQSWELHSGRSLHSLLDWRLAGACACLVEWHCKNVTDSCCTKIIQTCASQLMEFLVFLGSCTEYKNRNFFPWPLVVHLVSIYFRPWAWPWSALQHTVLPDSGSWSLLSVRPTVGLSAC